MGACSSCFLCGAEPEESPSPENDGVAELKMVEAEEASTPGTGEYYSKRCEAMMRSRGQFSDDVALEIEFSKSHWSEVVRAEVAPQSAEEEELNRENRELLKQLSQEYPDLFRDDLAGHYVLGRMVAEGAQAEIYEVVDRPDRVMKVFKRGTSLRDLQRSWPLPVLSNDVHRCIKSAGLLEDGRFAFVMHRWWGDLRKLIDQAMKEKNVDGVQGPPFPYELHGFTLYPELFMLEIARQMQILHARGVSHRDLKASNILGPNFAMLPFIHGFILLADFECSIGVKGTKFWRAPEILASLGKQETITNEQWEKADVYGYGMICFELVTGRIPFDGELENIKVDRQLVIDGKRPQLPSDLDEGVKDLIIKCWASDPTLRPTFSEIVDMIYNIPSSQWEFRSFGIDDELPPQYHLATVEEVYENQVVVVKAIPRFAAVNLANGYIFGNIRTTSILRLEVQSDARYKLARLHH